VHEGSREEHAPRLAGGHLAGESFRKMRYLHGVHRAFRAFVHFLRDFLMRPDADAGEESGQNNVPARDGARAGGHQVA